MSALFPDNSVLCNFAAVHRLDLLRDFLRGRGRWTAAVAAEAQASERHLPALRTIATEGWLGSPIDVDDVDDIRAVEVIRRHVFGGPASRPTQHLGEAQTCHVVATWSQFAGSVWISDDRESLSFAHSRGIHAWTTLDIMRAIVADGDLTDQAAFDLLLDMADAGRGLALPDSPRDLRD